MCYLPLSNLKNTFLRRLSSPCVCLARVYQAFSKHSPPLRDYREGSCGNMKMRGRREGRTTVVVKWFESTRLKMVHPDYRTMLRGTQEAQPPPVGKPTSSTSDYCVSLPMPSTSQLSTEWLCNYRLCSSCLGILNLHFSGHLKLFICFRKSYFFIHCFHHLLVSFLKEIFFFLV